MYPQIQLMPERLITEDGNVICSGGNSIYDLSLYMIEKYCLKNTRDFHLLSTEKNFKELLIFINGRTSRDPSTCAARVIHLL